MRTLTIATLLALAASGGPRLPAAASALPPLQAAAANDNRIAAGRLAHAELHVSLDARMVAWYPDGEGGAGIPIQAFAETGKRAQIPGPLIRVTLGTTIVASVHNAIPGSVLTMHGMMDRPTDRDSAVRVPFGTTHIIRFRAGAPGTYLYWGATSARTIHSRFGSDSQLSGAFVVDSPSSSTARNDRVFVIGQWINVRSKNGDPNFDYELDVINGRAWPHTERLSYERNAAVHWRWVNSSFGSHPLHLHGFYFTVDSRGDGLADNIYRNASDRDREVTELVEPGSTFTMTWHANRPGNWLFHCHLAYHIVGHMPIAAMLAGKDSITDDDYENNYVRHAGMGGLILGITVRAPESRATMADPAVVQRVHLRVERAADDHPDAPSFRYVLGDGDQTVAEPGAVGPPIVLTRGVPTAIDVTNLLNEPTAVHWHGVELENSYYDGVSAFSGYGDHVAPMIDPGQTFEARMTPPRAGTFAYHTHMDDVFQLRGGLVGPLIVLEPGKTFDPSSDHIFTITTTHALSDILRIFVNGTFSPPAITCRVGVLQRFRFINMTTFWVKSIVSLTAVDRTLLWVPLQVDGANVSQKRQIPESAVQIMTIGETRDFTYKPTHAGELQLQFLPGPHSPNMVTVPVHVVQ